MDAKVQEANALVKEGEKLETTNVFAMRFKPDYDGAASCYEKAGNLYRTAKAFEQAVHANKKLAKAHSELKNYFHAAKALETAAGFYKDQLKRIDLAAELLQQAVDLYRLNGSEDTAIQVLEKYAKLMEDINPEKAIAAYLQSAEINIEEGKPRQSTDPYKKAISLLLRNNKYTRAVKVMLEHAEVLKGLNQFEFVHFMFLSVIIAYLKEEDFAAADRASKDFLSVQGFAMSDCGRAAFDALDAYDKCDQSALDAVTKRQVFSFLDNEAAKLARTLKVPGSTGAAPSKPAAASSANNNSARDQLFSRPTPTTTATATPAPAPAPAPAPVPTATAPTPTATKTATPATETKSETEDESNEHASLFIPVTSLPPPSTATTTATTATTASSDSSHNYQEEDEGDLR